MFCLDTVGDGNVFVGLITAVTVMSRFWLKGQWQDSPVAPRVQLSKKKPAMGRALKENEIARLLSRIGKISAEHLRCCGEVSINLAIGQVCIRFHDRIS